MLELEKGGRGQGTLEGSPDRVLKPKRPEEGPHVVKGDAVAMAEWLII